MDKSFPSDLCNLILLGQKVTERDGMAAFSPDPGAAFSQFDSRGQLSVFY